MADICNSPLSSNTHARFPSQAIDGQLTAGFRQVEFSDEVASEGLALFQGQQSGELLRHVTYSNPFNPCFISVPSVAKETSGTVSGLDWFP
jgi:hypothetical protein